MKILQYYEKKNKYVQSINQIIHLKQNIMETLPIGGSQDFTDSGDDSGGGLAKQNNNFTLKLSQESPPLQPWDELA